MCVTVNKFLGASSDESSALGVAGGGVCVMMLADHFQVQSDEGGTITSSLFPGSFPRSVCVWLR